MVSISQNDLVRVLGFAIAGVGGILNAYLLIYSSMLYLVFCRYTGCIKGKTHLYGRTPVLCQVAIQSPKKGDFLHTRDAKDFVTAPQSDPCNAPETYKPTSEPVNLWPNLQHTGRRTLWHHVCSPGRSNTLIALWCWQDDKTVPSHL